MPKIKLEMKIKQPQIGYEVKLYLGAYNNIKVTTPEDLALAEIITQDMF